MKYAVPFLVTCLLLANTALANKAVTSPPVLDERIVVEPIERFSLAEQRPVMAGFDIRARRVLVPAGAMIQQHPHDTAPGIVYVESGTIVEYRGDKARTLKQGETLIEDVHTVHSYKNTSDQDCVLIAFDLPPTQ